jgi:TonB family protein
MASEDAAATTALENTEPVEAGSFEPPHLLHRPNPYYPIGVEMNREEGWVQIEFMVDQNGRTFEPTVADSSGNRELEEVALKETRGLAFQPATDNGQPVESSKAMKFVFQIQGQTGARAEFIYNYKKFMQAVRSSNESGARALLTNLTPVNLYEDAYFGLAQYEFAHSWGTDEEQLRGLRRAIAREKRSGYLPKDVFDSAMLALLPLDVKVGDYMQALSDWEYISSNIHDKQALDYWRPFVARIQTIQTSTATLRVHGHLSGGDWYFTPFKRTLQFDVTSGHLTALKLRCGKHFEVFDFKPDTKYRIEPRYGSCTIEAIGDADTQFDLIES